MDEVEAIEAGVGGQGDMGEAGEAGGEVDGADHFIRGAVGDGSGPAGDEGGSGAAFEDAVFTAAEGAIRAMAAVFFYGLVFVAVVEDGAVIGAEDDEGSFSELEAVESLKDLADGPVEFGDGIAAVAEWGGVLEAFVGHAGDVDIVGGEEEEEGLVLVGFDPVDGLSDPFIGEVFVTEAGLVSAGIEADTADAVMDGVIMAVGPIHFEGMAVGEACGVIGVGFFIADPKGVEGVEVEDGFIFHVDLGDAVVGGGEEEGVIEADLEGARGERAVPVRAGGVTEAEVPFSDDGGLVSGLFEEGGERGGSGLDDGGAIGGCDAGVILAEGVGAGEEGESGGGAGGGGAIATGEAEAFGGEAVDIGCKDVGGAVAGDIAVAEVIGHDDDDIGSGAGVGLGEEEVEQ